MLRVVRPEAGEDHQVFDQNHQVSSTSDSPSDSSTSDRSSGFSTSLTTGADRRVVVNGMEGNPGSISPAGIAPGKKHPQISLGGLSSLKAYLK